MIDNDNVLVPMSDPITMSVAMWFRLPKNPNWVFGSHFHFHWYSTKSIEIPAYVATKSRKKNATFINLCLLSRCPSAERPVANTDPMMSNTSMLVAGWGVINFPVLRPSDSRSILHVWVPVISRGKKESEELRINNPEPNRIHFGIGNLGGNKAMSIPIERNIIP